MLPKTKARCLSYLKEESKLCRNKNSSLFHNKVPDHKTMCVNYSMFSHVKVHEMTIEIKNK